MVEISQRENSYVTLKIGGSRVIDDDLVNSWRKANRKNCNDNNIYMFIVLIKSMNKEFEYGEDKS